MERTQLIADGRDLFPEKWKSDPDIHRVHVRVYASNALTIQLRLRDRYEKPVDALSRALDMDIKEFILGPGYTGDGLVAHGMMRSTEHPAAHYLILLAAERLGGTATASPDVRLDFARVALVSLFGENAAVGCRASYAIETASGKRTVSSNPIRQPPLESTIAVFPTGDSATNLQGLGSKPLSAEALRAIKFLSRAADEQYWTLKMFFYLLAIEALGRKSSLGAGIHAPYRTVFKTEHDARAAFRVAELTKLRNDFAHKAIQATEDGELERIAQLLAPDALQFHVSGTHYGLALEFVRGQSEQYG